MPRAMQALDAFERRLFTAPRIRLLGGAVLALTVVVFIWAVVSGQSVVTRNADPSPADFSFIYVSGLMAASPHPAMVYDFPAFSTVQATLFGTRTDGLPYYHFLYPPIFLLITGVIGLLPFVLAAVVWIGGSALFYLAAARAILPQAALLVPAAAPLAVLKNAQLGQNGFLTAGLIGFTLALVERRPVLAGICLGVLTYKPQFGILFPFALIAAGRWRVIASAAATAAILALVVTFVFGSDVWGAYFGSLRRFDARLSPDQQVAFQYQSVFGWLQAHGASLTVASGTHLVAAALVAVIVCVVWRRPAPPPLRAAALAIGAAAATPYVLTYDLVILTIAIAFLAQDGLARGFLVGERLLLALCVTASFLLTAPVAPLLYITLLCIAVWRWLALPAPTASTAIQPGVAFAVPRRLAPADE